MKLGEYSFRETAGRYLLLTDPKLVALAAESFQMAEPTNALLAYCYISHGEGLSLELLCFVHLVGDCPVFYPAILADPPMQIAYSAAREGEALLVDEHRWDLSSFREVRTRLKEAHEALFPGVLAARKLRELDPLRAPDFPDDIRVILVQENCQPEDSWMRLDGLTEDGKLEGSLLLAPLQNFGVAQNATVKAVMTQQDGECFCLVSL